MNYFEGLNYEQYCIENEIHKLPGIEVDLSQYGNILEKKTKKWDSVDPTNLTPFMPELDDLIRLHYLIRKRKVRTVMEFGIGKSSSVFIDALSKNKTQYGTYVSDNLRCSTPFELHCIENNAGWLSIVEERHKNNEIFHPHLCPLEVSTFCDRLCTYYHNLPNIRPDFIYIDGPDQFSAGGSVRGLSTNHKDRMPMAADVLVIEHFLEPGTMILLDGRTANARFLKANFQRNWIHSHFSEFDQHIFELVEEPLGKWNKAALQFIKQ